MGKSLFRVVLLGFLAVHFNVHALGLGDIQLDSALNQPLSAEIELLSATPEDADSINVSLASYETFAKVGIDRPSILALLRFNVAAQGGGYIIKVDSHDPIREPFLDFILEVTWSSGRVLREYTLLLDPPEFKRAQPAQIQAPATQPAAEVAPTPAQLPTWEAPVRPGSSTRSSKLVGTFTPTDEGGVKYGPVRDGETLWRIARELRQDSSVSTQQMLMALLEENPEAFIAGDINRLKRGSILRLNNPDILASIGHQDFMTEVAQRPRSTATGMKKPADMDEQMISADTAAAQRPSLKLVTPDTERRSDKMGATVAEGGDEALRQELMLALEISEAQRRENEALKDRMSDLQKQLDALKRLVTLKDGDLAQIQQQFSQDSEIDTAGQAEVAAVVEEEALEPVQDSGMVPSSEIVTGADESATALVIPEVAETEETIAEAMVKQAEAPKPEMEEPEVAPKPAPRPKVAPVPVVKPAAEQDFFSIILDEPMFMAAGGGTLLLVLLLGLLAIKRRGNRFHESILSGDASSSIGAGASGGPDTSFLSDLAISGLAGGSMDADEGEVDPITEADVYMAYGRTQQAESLLKDALESDPERLELKSKLIEVYFTAKDKEHFDTLIAESADQMQGDEGAWKKIQIMGHEMSPENPLFAEAPAVEEGEEEELELTEGEETILDDVLDIGIDLDELSAEMESSEGELDIDLGLDFSDLDEDLFSSSADEAIAEGEESESDESPALDDGAFDLGELDLDLDEGLEEEDEGVIDFNIDDLDMGNLEVATKPDAKSSAVDSESATSETDDSTDADGFDFSLDDLDNLEETTAEDLSAQLDDALSSIDDDLHSIGDLGDLSTDDSEGDEADDGIGGLDDLELELDLGDLDEESSDTEDLAADLELDDSSEESSDTADLTSDLELDLGDLGDDSSDELDDFDLDLESIAGERSGDDLDSVPSSDSTDATELLIGDDELDDLSDLDLDIFDETDELGELDEGGSELDLSEGDMNTKIDLAKAYIEMGDADGARNMLDEVVAQGDDTQKQQAQDLLDSI